VSYREQFDEYLDNVVRGRDEVARRALFWEWAGSHGFVCEGCLEEFTPEWEGLKEDAKVHCPECVAWARGYAHGRKSAKGPRR
jgi:hypothetical protein